MDPQLKDIQLGRRVIIHSEQVRGCVRCLWPKLFRRCYIRRMEACRRGDFNPCPHEVLDLKFYRNQGGWHWDAADGPFTWSDQIPFARVGMAEPMVLGCRIPVADRRLCLGRLSLTGCDPRHGDGLGSHFGGRCGADGRVLSRLHGAWCRRILD